MPENSKNSDDKIINVIRHLNKGIRDVKASPSVIIKDNLNTILVGSKLIKDSVDPTINKNTFDIEQNISQLTEIYKSLSNKMENSENVLRLFPDLNMAMNIVISSIMAPKDMLSTNISYTFENDLLPPDITTVVLDIIEKDLNEFYKLKDSIPTMLKESIFLKGSYPVVIIPEGSLDEIINSDLYLSQENLNNLNIGNAALGFISTESISVASNTEVNKNALMRKHLSKLIDKNVTVSDNINILKIPKANEVISKHNSRNMYKRNRRNGANITLESLNLDNIFRTRSNMGTNQVTKIKNKEDAKRSSLGRPLVMRLNSESVIPVHVPGDTTKHIGYFVLINEEGLPVNKDELIDTYLNGSNSSTSLKMHESLTDRAAKNLSDLTNDKIGVKELLVSYKKIVEQELIEKIKKGTTKKSVAISNSNEIYITMLTRALREDRTAVLYIPEELLTYFAYSFRPNGTGKSLLDDVSILTSLRSVLLFSKIMAEAKSSIAITDVTITLDPNDQDPDKTLELIRDNILKLRQQYFPFGSNNLNELTDWVQRAGVMFNYDGHPGMPNTKVTFEPRNFDHIKPDSELEENLRKQTIQALGPTPEMIDDSFGPDFATVASQNRIMFSKRISLYQEAFEKHLDSYINKIIYNDEVLRDKLKIIINDNINKVKDYLSEEMQDILEGNIEEFLELFVDKMALDIKLRFSRPDLTNIQNLTAALEEYSKAVDTVLDTVIADNFLGESIIGDLNEHIPSIREAVKAHLLRKWVSDNNYVPEVLGIFSLDQDNQPNHDIDTILSDHVKTIQICTAKTLEKLKLSKKATNQDLVDMELTEGDGGSTGSYDTSSDSDNSSDSSEDSGDDSIEKSPIDEETGEISGMNIDF